MNVLITGASGYIASFLIRNLLQDNENYIYGISRSKLSIANNNFYHINIDISKPNWTNIIPKNIDIIVHLAQSKKYRDFPNGTVDMVSVNIDSTHELIEWSRKNNVSKFLFASTGNVYKQSSNLHKEIDACEPEGIYAATKLSAELLIKQYSTFFQALILRIFGVYGPNQSNMIIPNIIECIKKGKEIFLAKGVGLYLTPLYILDCVKIIEELLKYKDLATYNVFNLAGNEVLNLYDISNYISNHINKKPVFKKTDDNPKYFLGNNEKINKTIKYYNYIKFCRGIKNTIEGIR